MAKVELKQPIVDEIKEMLDGAQSAVAVKYLGITVEQDTKLRKELRENGVSYKVFKNTLIKRAAEGTEFAALDPDLEGPTALAVSKTDATAPARIVAKYAKDIQALELKSGVVEGQYYDKAGISTRQRKPRRQRLPQWRKLQQRLPQQNKELGRADREVSAICGDGTGFLGYNLRRIISWQR